MNFVLVGPAYPYRGGIAHFNDTMAAGLLRRGHQVSMVTFRRQYPELLFPGRSQYEAEPREAPVSAERLIDSVNPRSWWQAARRIRDLAPDAVIFQQWMPFFAPALGTIARFSGRARRLAVVHNALPHEGRPGDRLLTRYLTEACDGFIVLSEAVEQDLRDRLGVRAPIRRVHHPVYDLFGEPMPRDAARDALGLPPDAPVFLFFGLVRAYKGLRILLEAMPTVIRRVPDVRLVIAGEFYDDEAPYRALIRDHGMEEHVHVRAEYIPGGEVARYFSAADAVVQPYLSATQSGVVQIAYHFDRPVIVTDVGGLAEVVPPEAGRVVPPNDAAGLADALVRFVEDAERDRLVDGVRREKQKYGWDPLHDAVQELARGEPPAG